MSEQKENLATASRGHGEDQGHLTVTIVNEENGEEFTLNGGKGTPIHALISQMYEKLNLTRQNDDRLRCESSQENVFDFSNLHLGDYLDAGHCPDLVWLFAGGTGGAA